VGHGFCSLFVFTPFVCFFSGFSTALLSRRPPPSEPDPRCGQPWPHAALQGSAGLLFAYLSFQDLSLPTTQVQLDFNKVVFNFLPEKTEEGRKPG